jgi:hypothetical protein
MSDNSVIQPLGRVFVHIVCSNPKCHRVFSVELDEKGERLCTCRKCGKRYYIHGGTKVWVKALTISTNRKVKRGAKQHLSYKMHDITSKF